jgi:D-glycero-D-manno-heptose 1,7-bisphosphate phosphatase
MSAPAIFLDKDGTLIDDVPYNVDPALISLRPGAGEALRRLRAAGFRLIVVSNQSGVARGLFEEQALAGVEERLRALLAAEQIALEAFIYCPHHPDGVVAAFARDCDCRKPAPGMLLRAARDHDLDLARSWLFGDILDDCEAAHRAGCRAVLVDSGGETVWQLTPPRTPEATVPNLLAAAGFVLSAREPLPGRSPPARLVGLSPPSAHSGLRPRAAERKPFP